MKSKFFLIF